METTSLRLKRLAWFLAGAGLVAACGGGTDPAAGDPASGGTPAPAPVPAPAPAPPPATAGSATLSWNPPQGSIAGYRVYYGTMSGAYGQALGRGAYTAQSTFTVSGLTSGRTYYFAVTAIDAAGLESDYSNEASKTIP